MKRYDCLPNKETDNARLDASTVPFQQKDDSRFKKIIALSSVVFFVLIVAVLMYVKWEVIKPFFSFSEIEIENNENSKADIKNKLLEQTKEKNSLLVAEINTLKGELKDLKLKDEESEKVKLAKNTTLFEENKKILLENEGLLNELAKIGERKKKLDEYTRQVVGEKEDMVRDMAKLTNFKVNAQRALWMDEKKILEGKLKKSEIKVNEQHEYIQKSLADYKKIRESGMLDKNVQFAISEAKTLKAELSKVKQVMHYNNGTFYTDMSMFEEAASEYQKVIEINPENFDSYYNLAVLYDLNLDDKELASKFYKKYLEFKPDAKDRNKVLSWIKTIEKESSN